MSEDRGSDDQLFGMCVSVCVFGTAGSESESLCITPFSYADQLVLLFTVHMFIYVNIQWRIKAFMSHKTLSGSHGGGLTLYGYTRASLIWFSTYCTISYINFSIWINVSSPWPSVWSEQV